MEWTPYDQMGKTDSMTYLVTSEVGVGFSSGAVGGFAYHLAKGLVSPHPRHAFRLACQHAPRVGGVGAVFCGVASGVQIVDKYVRYGKEDYFGFFLCAASAAAAVRAKHGFRSASCTGLGVGTLLTLYSAWITRMMEKYDSSSSSSLSS